MSRFVIGIDLGINGGLVFMDDECRILEKMCMPRHPVDKEIDHYEIEAFFARCKSYAKDKGPIEVWMEKVWGIMGNGMKSVNTFGERNGYVKGLCHVWFERKYKEVTPRTWQKWLTTEAAIEEIYSNGKRDTKRTTEKALTTLYAGEDFRKNTRCKINHDGIMDAVGIARYGVKNG